MKAPCSQPHLPPSSTISQSFFPSAPINRLHRKSIPQTHSAKAIRKKPCQYGFCCLNEGGESRQEPLLEWRRSRQSEKYKQAHGRPAKTRREYGTNTGQKHKPQPHRLVNSTKIPQGLPLAPTNVGDRVGNTLNIIQHSVRLLDASTPE